MRLLRRVPTCMLSLLLCGGCAAMSPVQIGQTAGTIAGAAAAPGLGAPMGAVLGSLLGLVVQREIDKVTETRERKDLGEQLGTTTAASPPSQAPALSGAPTRVWVDETLRDGKTLAGHFETRPL